jgi:hypothetical protein
MNIPLDLAHTFPLVLELDELGWDVDISLRGDEENPAKRCLFVYCSSRTNSQYFNVFSTSSTDPSDAIAKCYLLVRKEMGM